jgi:hypothetical protein
MKVKGEDERFRSEFGAYLDDGSVADVFLEGR